MIKDRDKVDIVENSIATEVTNRMRQNVLIAPIVQDLKHSLSPL